MTRGGVRRANRAIVTRFEPCRASEASQGAQRHERRAKSRDKQHAGRELLGQIALGAGAGPS